MIKGTAGRMQTLLVTDIQIQTGGSDAFGMKARGVLLDSPTFSSAKATWEEAPVEWPEEVRQAAKILIEAVEHATARHFLEGANDGPSSRRDDIPPGIIPIGLDDSGEGPAQL